MPVKKFAAQVYIPKASITLIHDGREVFNIWRASAMTPKAGDVQWFLDHIAYMFPGDKNAQRHVLDFMAQLVQHPEVKIHFALLIQSVDEVGKGALGRILVRIIGDRNCVEPSNDEVTRNWTGWQEGAQLAIINELMAKGRTDVLDRLKSPITEDKLRIEKKFGNTFKIPNHMNFFCMTNYKDALALSLHDRRWLVLFSPAKPKEGSYYTRLFDIIEKDHDKIAAVMHYLLNHKIAFNPKAPAPFTEAKADMQERSESDVSALLRDLYDGQSTPFNQPLIRVADIVDRLRQAWKGEKNLTATASAFLDRIGAVKLNRYKHGRDGLPAWQVYAIRDHDHWDKQDADVAIRAYLQQGEDEDDWG